MSLPVDRTIADTIAGGALGDITAIDLRVFTGDYPNADAPLHWRQDRISPETTPWRSASGTSR